MIRPASHPPAAGPPRNTASVFPLLQHLRVSAAGFSESGKPFAARSKAKSAEYLLLYCSRGAGRCDNAGRLGAIRAGDFFLSSNAPFAVGPQPSDPWAVFWVWARGRDLPDYLRMLGVGAGGGIFHTGDDPMALRLLNEVVGHMGGSAGGSALLQASAAVAYLLSILIHKKLNSPPRDADALRKIAETIIFMSEHLQEPLRVSALARMACLSPAHFGELFKAQTGCAPRDYLHLLRIHKACELLRATELPIKDIAARIGYSDQFHFSRQFKAFEGLSPSVYRQRPHP